MNGRIRIGISGWRYAPWRGVFYPKDLPQRRELEYASREFGSIEIDGPSSALWRPHPAALVVADPAASCPPLEDLTGDFVSFPLPGAGDLYARGYTPQALPRGGGRIRRWRHGEQPARGPRVSRKPPR